MTSSSGLPQECSVSQVLWTECLEDSKPGGPPAPKRPRHGDHIPMTDSLMSTKGVSPDGRVCCVLKTPLPVLTSHSLEATLVCSWRTLDNEATHSLGARGSSCYRLAGLGTITLSVDEISSCSLNYNMECLSLWNGECSYAVEAIVMVSTLSRPSVHSFLLHSKFADLNSRHFICNAH